MFEPLIVLIMAMSLAIGQGVSGDKLTGWAVVDPGQAPGHAAAGPALRQALGGDPAFRGEKVTLVKTVDGKERSIEVTLTDYCGCNTTVEKLIDLNPGDFRTLTGRDPGKAWVRIYIDGHVVHSEPKPTPPPTDTE